MLSMKSRLKISTTLMKLDLQWASVQLPRLLLVLSTMAGQSFYSLEIENGSLQLSQSMCQDGPYLPTLSLKVRIYKKAGLMGSQMAGGLMLVLMAGLLMRLGLNGLIKCSFQLQIHAGLAPIYFLFWMGMAVILPLNLTISARRIGLYLSACQHTHPTFYSLWMSVFLQS